LFFDGTPCYPVEELLQFRLPSEDRLWDAGNAQMWEQLYRHPEREFPSAVLRKYKLT